MAFEYDVCGYAQVAGSVWRDSGNWLRVQRFTVARAGTLVKITDYTNADKAGCGWRGVVYADSAGLPGALLVVSAEQIIAYPAGPAWLDSAPLSVAVAAGQVIHVGSWHAPGVAVYYGGSTGASQNDKSGPPPYSASGPPPDPFGATATTANQVNSIYATIAVEVAAAATQVIVVNDA